MNTERYIAQDEGALVSLRVIENGAPIALFPVLRKDHSARPAQEMAELFLRALTALDTNVGREEFVDFTCDDCGCEAAIAALLTTEQVAALLGRDASRVRRLAETHGRGHRFGERLWLFTPADVEYLRNVRAGRPRRATP